MEGGARPGHFDGVATVVAKLFNAAGPCRAFFGEKDWQQLQVVRRMTTDLSFPVDVIGCPTVRADDGLALSSRNVYLDTEDRAAAPVLFRALTTAAALGAAGERDLVTLRTAIAAVVATEPRARLDYAEAVQLDHEIRLLVAAQVGPARLIDNLGVTL
jgi:pantoate--beta-alanine ligase